MCYFGNPDIVRELRTSPYTPLYHGSIAFAGPFGISVALRVDESLFLFPALVWRFSHSTEVGTRGVGMESNNHGTTQGVYTNATEQQVVVWRERGFRLFPLPTMTMPIFLFVSLLPIFSLSTPFATTICQTLGGASGLYQSSDPTRRVSFCSKSYFCNRETSQIREQRALHEVREVR